MNKVQNIVHNGVQNYEKNEASLANTSLNQNLSLLQPIKQIWFSCIIL